MDKYAKDDTLYPKNLYLRARVNQTLHFDTGVLFVKARSCSEAVFFKGATEFPREGIAEIQSSYDLLEASLKDDLYLVGNNITVADYCCLATVSTSQISAPVDPVRYPKITQWFERMTRLPFYEETNGRRVEALKQYLYGRMNSNKATVTVKNSK